MRLAMWPLDDRMAMPRLMCRFVLHMKQSVHVGAGTQAILSQHEEKAIDLPLSAVIWIERYQSVRDEGKIPDLLRQPVRVLTVRGG